jgi:serine phosphatase RsbU (regulator of sigma subunit)/pSer/pThr/pTyr-binding forkhead associated (FHA) protein
MELLISGPEDSSKTVELAKDNLSLGRSADNDLAYPQDPWLSRYHLRFERQNGNWFVKDCSSRNGTTVNNTSLKQRYRLRKGDRIYAGHLTIEVRESPVEPARPLVSFVTQDEQKATGETVVTSLDEVLAKTANAEERDSSLTSNRVVRALIRAGQELAIHRPLSEVFGAILEFSLSAVNAKRGVILTLEQNGELAVRASNGEGFSISTAVRDRVLQEKCSLMIRDAQVDDALRRQKSIVLHRVRSMMAVPLQTGDRVIGLIYVDNGAVIYPFSQEDLDLLTVMANVAAIRIEHARLASVEQMEQLMESELAQASEIQRSLLPAEAPVCEGYQLGGYNVPCRTVGGDYYDFLPYRDGRLGLVIGDVSGKGLPAALMMSSLQARVQMLIETQPDPASAVCILNRNIAARCPLGKFITFFYGLLDPASGSLAYSNAGHNYPLVIRADGTVERLSGGGIIMGLFPAAPYELKHIQLNPGDLLALYSDGVTEAANERDHEFGEQGLIDFLLAHRLESCAGIASGLVQHVRGWSAASSFADDFTIVLARRNGAAA